MANRMNFQRRVALVKQGKSLDEISNIKQHNLDGWVKSKGKSRKRVNKMNADRRRPTDGEAVELGGETMAEDSEEEEVLDDVSDYYKKAIRGKSSSEQYRALLLLGNTCSPNKGMRFFRVENGERKIVKSPKGLFMSEKLDGQRAMWHRNNDGNSNRKGQLKTARGVVYKIPEWFYELLPADYCLDGELWIGRGSFNEIGFLRSQKPMECDWLKVTYNLFNIPIEGTVWETNQEWLKKIVRDCRDRWIGICKKYGLKGNMSCPIRILKQHECKDEKHFYRYYNNILKKGGEGVVLVNPKMRYFGGRTTDLYKAKPEDDAEAEIIGYKMSESCKGELGAFRVRAYNGNAGVKDGVEFTISCENTREMQTNWDAKKGVHSVYGIGDIVTYKYAEVQPKSRKPRFPKLKGKRLD